MKIVLEFEFKNEYLCRKMKLSVIPNFRLYEGLDGGGGVWYSLFIKNLAHYSLRSRRKHLCRNSDTLYLVCLFI